MCDTKLCQTLTLTLTIKINGKLNKSEKEIKNK